MPNGASYKKPEEQQLLSALNIDRKRVDVPVRKCDYCGEIVPIIDDYKCRCGVTPPHVNTVEDPREGNEGFMVFIYQCANCKDKVSKTLKFSSESEDLTTVLEGKKDCNTIGSKEKGYSPTNELRKPMCF